jgi:outer membrane protein OmpA-like peptidoglycan-associated protein
MNLRKMLLAGSVSSLCLVSFVPMVRAAEPVLLAQAERSGSLERQARAAARAAEAAAARAAEAEEAARAAAERAAAGGATDEDFRIAEERAAQAEAARREAEEAAARAEELAAAARAGGGGNARESVDAESGERSGERGQARRERAREAGSEAESSEAAREPADPRADEAIETTVDDDPPANARDQRRRERRSEERRQQAAEPQAEEPADDRPANARDQRRREREERRQAAEPDAEEPVDDAGEQAIETAPADDRPADAREERRRERERRQVAEPDAEEPVDDAGEQAIETAPADGRPADAREERRRERERRQAEEPGRPSAPVAEPAPEMAPPARDRAGQASPGLRQRAEEREERRRERERRRAEQQPEVPAAPVPPSASPVEQQIGVQRGAEQLRELRRLREKLERERERIEALQDAAEPDSATSDGRRDPGDRRAARERDGAGSTQAERRRERREEAGDRGEVVQRQGGRLVIRLGDQFIIEADRDDRLLSRARDVDVEDIGNGRTRTTVYRPNGVRIVTVKDRFGDIVTRSRVMSNGEVVMLIDNRQAEDGRPWRERRRPYVEIEPLPPLVLRIPEEQYIVETGRASRRQVEEALIAPPVERVERRYTLDEVRYSDRLRDKVRRVDLDTITFATGSAVVSLDQLDALDSVGLALEELIASNPDEIFLIEGHTDAVGSNASNLLLSDLRAEAVAVALSEDFDIPPENLVTQGYGEEQLKIPTEAAERENRRVAIRRITPLLRAER